MTWLSVTKGVRTQEEWGNPSFQTGQPDATLLVLYLGNQMKTV